MSMPRSAMRTPSTTHSSIGGGIVPDFLSARISFSTRRNSGLFKNVTDGRFVTIASNPNPTGATINHRTGGVPQDA